MAKARLVFFVFCGLLWGAAASAAGPADAYVAQGQKLYAARDYAKAQTYFTYAAKLAPTDVRAWKGVGYCLYAQRQYAKSLQYLQYAQRLSPGDGALAQFVAGVKRLAQGSSGQAAAQTQAGNMANGYTYYKAQRYKEAAGFFQQETVSNPGNAAAWQYLGYSRAALNDKAGALQACEQALRLAPGNQALAAYVSQLRGSAGVAAGGGAGSGGDWVQPAWRSAILPGWGQFYNGHPTKGLILGGLTLGLLAGEFGTYMLGSQARDQYLGLTDPNADYNTPYNTWSNMANLNHIFFFGMTAAYLYTVVDAIIDGRSGGAARASLSLPQNMDLAMQPGGVSVRWKLAEF